MGFVCNLLCCFVLVKKVCRLACIPSFIRNFANIAGCVQYAPLCIPQRFSYFFSIIFVAYVRVSSPLDLRLCQGLDLQFHHILCLYVDDATFAVVS